jgi:hypothetical protein
MSDAPQTVDASSRPFRRKVFYIPGYDPIHPRRYRELYRKEGADQAARSGYDLRLMSKTTEGPYGWRVRADIGGAVEAEVQVLVWSDIVRASMAQGIAATYLQLVRTAAAYILTGALFRLMRLRKGPMIAALYPIGMLLLQLTLAMAAGYGLFRLGRLVHPVLGAVAGISMLMLILRGFRKYDSRLYVYYLMHDYA